MAFLFFGIGILIAVCGQLLLKAGVESKPLTPSLKIITDILTNPFLIIGFVLYGFGALYWLFILKKYPLSVAYPTLSISYVVIVIASFLIFKEPLTATKIIGIVLICSGVVFLFK